MISSSFAPGLEALINAAIDAAYKDSECMGDSMYVDQKRGASADLSACRLWTRNVSSRDRMYDAALVGAVLWRLISGWQGSPASSHGGNYLRSGTAVPAGSVLEVLFLATSVQARESGQAMKLIAELENVATELGCAAIAVAAVPVQGRGFWTRNGYEVVVPLKHDEESGKEDPGVGGDGPFLAEPLTELGAFLLNHMLLFTDTPLMAKVLRPRLKRKRNSQGAAGSQNHGHSDWEKKCLTILQALLTEESSPCSNAGGKQDRLDLNKVLDVVLENLRNCKYDGPESFAVDMQRILDGGDLCSKDAARCKVRFNELLYDHGLLQKWSFQDFQGQWIHSLPWIRTVKVVDAMVTLPDIRATLELAEKDGRFAVTYIPPGGGRPQNWFLDNCASDGTLRQKMFWNTDDGAFCCYWVRDQRSTKKLRPEAPEATEWK